MEKFLSKVAKHILAKHGNNLAGTTILLPNHRSCVYLKQALRENSEETIWSPEIATLRDWIHDKSKLALIESLEQVMELYSVYQEKGGEETLDEFIPMAQTMLADFNEVDLQLADAKPFFNYLEQLQSMKVYTPGEELSEYSIQYKNFWKMFRELYFGLQDRLTKKGKGYEGMLYRDVATNIETILSNSEWSGIVAGFSSLTKSEEKIIKTLRTFYSAEIIWDTDQYYVDDEYQEAGTYFRKYKNEWRVNNNAWQNNLIATGNKNINIIGVAKSVGQTKVVADILANKLQTDSTTEKETVVVVPDETILRPLLSAIPGNVSAINVSMGFPLKDSLISVLLKALFSLHDNIERFHSKKKSSLRFYYNDVFDLLHHPYTDYLIPDKKTVSSFIERVRHRNRVVIGYKELSEIFKQTEFEKLFWYTDDVTEYLNKLLTLIDALRFHFLTLTQNKEKDLSVDIELLFHFNSVLKNLQNVISENQHEINVTPLRKLLSEIIRPLRVPFEGEPVQGLQMMGIMETQCLDFKNVVIVSMNEGIFPTAKKQNSYIPYEMRKEFLSTHREKDAVAAYLFYRLLQRAENVFLIYNTESDELGGGEKSRFVMQLQHELQRANKNAVIKDLVYSVDPPPAVPEDAISIIKDEVLMKKLVDNLSDYGISPSAINTYINCSLQYYLRYVAGLREKDDVEESIEAATLGSAVHYVLENLYKESIGKNLSPTFIENILKDKPKTDNLLRQAFAERFDHENLSQGKNYLLYRVCLKLIDEFLKQEKNNLKLLEDSGSSLKLIMLEKEMLQPLQIGTHEIKIRGKVDRVEESNNIISIADYKTGTPTGSTIKSDDIKLFATDPKYAKGMQLLTYAWLYWRSNNAPDIMIRSGIYWLRQITQGFDALQLDGSDIITRDILLQFEDVLKNVLGELLNPEVPFSKTNEIERCAHCEFAEICRRSK